jgi:predicted HTH domain antitoxin
MAISIELPPDIESLLTTQYSDLAQAAKEALTVEAYRSGKFGISTVRRILGFETRWEAEQWLADRHVPINYGPEDLEADRRTLDRVLGGNVAFVATAEGDPLGRPRREK